MQCIVLITKYKESQHSIIINFGHRMMALMTFRRREHTRALFDHSFVWSFGQPRKRRDAASILQTMKMWMGEEQTKFRIQLSHWARMPLMAKSCTQFFGRIYFLLLLGEWKNKNPSIRLLCEWKLKIALCLLANVRGGHLKLGAYFFKVRKNCSQHKWPEFGRFECLECFDYSLLLLCICVLSCN